MSSFVDGYQVYLIPNSIPNKNQLLTNLP